MVFNVIKNFCLNEGCISFCVYYLPFSFFNCYESVNDARPYIDEMVFIYLETNHATEMQELNQLLDEQVEISKQLYGEDSKHEAYKQTKLNDLKKRMGNAVLTEMREQIREDRAKRINQQKQGRKHSNFTYAP
ncbi:relaxase MobL [Virgibacillus chiguensis]|nr:relaxase MobL [Virgibacillus chiguensis]